MPAVASLLSCTVSVCILLAQGLQRLLHALAVLLEERDAALGYVLIIVCNAVEQEKDEVGLVASQAHDLHVLHPVLDHVVKISAHVLRSVIHNLPEHRDAVVQKWLRVSGANYFLKTAQRNFADFAVLMAQIDGQALDCCLEELTNLIGMRLSQLACKVADFLLHFRVRVVAALCDGGADHSELRNKLKLVLLQTKF